MAKVSYDSITFDSQLEVDYYKHLKEQGYSFINKGILEYRKNRQCNTSVVDKKCFFFHLQIPIQLAGTTYTPDFVLVENGEFTIVETKGYNQFSAMRDAIIHNQMKDLTPQYLRSWLDKNGLISKGQSFCAKVKYQKIKYLKAHGFVDFHWKNPNSLAKSRKRKLDEKAAETKQLKLDHKNEMKELRDKVKELTRTINVERHAHLNCMKKVNKANFQVFDRKDTFGMSKGNAKYVENRLKLIDELTKTEWKRVE